jgi:hypothetical protein
VSRCIVAVVCLLSRTFPCSPAATIFFTPPSKARRSLISLIDYYFSPPTPPRGARQEMRLDLPLMGQPLGKLDRSVSISARSLSMSRFMTPGARIVRAVAQTPRLFVCIGNGAARLQPQRLAVVRRRRRRRKEGVSRHSRRHASPNEMFIDRKDFCLGFLAPCWMYGTVMRYCEIGAATLEPGSMVPCRHVGKVSGGRPTTLLS